MFTSEKNDFNGVYAATICPFTPDGRVDEGALAEHIDEVSSRDGIVGLLVNGHAGENFMLNSREKLRVLEVADEVCGKRSILVNGINAENSYEARQDTAQAREAGADIALIFPPFSWALSHTTEMAVRHHVIANDAAQMPLMLYQAGVNAGAMAYSHATLEALVRLHHVVGIKEGSWETSAYEGNRALVKRIAPRVAVMASGDEHLFSCFALGSEGSLVSLAIVIPDIIVDLERAVREGDLPRARAMNARIYPLAKAIYGASPGGYANARLKTCLKLLGRLKNDAVRSPIPALPKSEIAMLEQAMKAAGL
ncbi:MAG: dihydrodipicolinate synthase family protein [Candidimonas sp.]